MTQCQCPRCGAHLETQLKLVSDKLVVSRTLLADIAREVAKKHGVTVEDLRGPRTTPRLVRARDEGIERSYRETDNSQAAIGRFYGGRDRTCVSYVLDKLGIER